MNLAEAKDLKLVSNSTASKLTDFIRTRKKVFINHKHCYRKQLLNNNLIQLVTTQFAA